MKFVVYIAFICLQLIGCSNAGNAPTKPKGPQTTEPTGEEAERNKETKNYNTSVGFLLSPKTNLITDDCPTPTRTPSLRTMNEVFTLDGKIAEWSGIPLLLKDASGDSRSGIDLTDFSAAFAKEDSSESVVGYIGWSGAASLPNTVEVFIEFGRYHIAENDNQQWQQNRIFRLDSKGVSEFRFGKWIDANDSAEWKAGQGVLEWRIDRRQLDSSLLKPIWWTRAYTRVGTVEGDATGAVLLPSVDHDAGQKISYKSCLSGSNDRVSSVFQFVKAEGVDSDLANKVFNIAYLAYDSLQNVLGYQKFPSNRFTVVVTPLKFDKQLLLLPDLYDGDVYRPLEVVLDEDLVEKLKYGFHTDLFEWFINKYASHYLAWYGSSQGQGFYLDWLANMLQTKVEAKVYSIFTRLSSFHKAVEPALVDFDLIEPIPDLYQRLAGDFENQGERESLQQIADAKIRSIAELALFRFDLDIFLKSWRLGAERFKETLISQVPSAGEIEKIWMGWFDERSYSEKYAPAWLSDPDNDGLPNFFEDRLGSNPRMLDSDEDGWSDYAEIFANTHFDDAAHRPRTITVDGYFNDWQELLPAEVIKPDTTLNSKCPEEAGIMAIASLASGSALIISVAPKKIDLNAERHDLSWEIQIQLAYSHKTLILRAEQGRYGYSLIDAKSGKLMSWVPTVTKNMSPAGEWVVDFEQYGLDAKLEKNGAAKIKVTSILEGRDRRLCSSSPWMYPLYHAD